MRPEMITRWLESGTAELERGASEPVRHEPDKALDPVQPRITSTRITPSSTSPPPLTHNAPWIERGTRRSGAGVETGAPNASRAMPIAHANAASQANAIAHVTHT